MRSHAGNRLQRLHIDYLLTVILSESRRAGTSRRTCICFRSPQTPQCPRRPPSRSVPWRAQRNHASMIHNRHAIAQPLRLFHVVRGQDDGATRLLQALHQIPHMTPRLRIEPRRRLIEKQQLRIADQRASPWPAAAFVRRSSRPRAPAASPQAAPSRMAPFNVMPRR